MFHFIYLLDKFYFIFWDVWKSTLFLPLFSPHPLIQLKKMLSDSVKGKLVPYLWHNIKCCIKWKPDAKSVTRMVSVFLLPVWLQSWFLYMYWTLLILHNKVMSLWGECNISRPSLLIANKRRFINLSRYMLLVTEYTWWFINIFL